MPSSRKGARVYNVIEGVSRTLCDMVSLILSSDPQVEKFIGLDFSDQAISASLSSPDSMDNGVSVYLYSVRPNPYLGNTEENIIRNIPGQGDLYEQRKYDMSLDLYYMITPHLSNHSLELKAIERVMQILNGLPVLTEESLDDEIVEAGNREIRIEPISLNLDETNKLWSIFPNTSYKVSIFYVLTPVSIKSFRVPEFASPAKEILTAMRRS